MVVNLATNAGKVASQGLLTIQSRKYLKGFALIAKLPLPISLKEADNCECAIANNATAKKNTTRGRKMNTTQSIFKDKKSLESLFLTGVMAADPHQELSGEVRKLSKRIGSDLLRLISLCVLSESAASEESIAEAEFPKILSELQQEECKAWWQANCSLDVAPDELARRCFQDLKYSTPPTNLGEPEARRLGDLMILECIAIGSSFLSSIASTTVNTEKKLLESSDAITSPLPESVSTVESIPTENFTGDIASGVKQQEEQKIVPGEKNAKEVAVLHEAKPAKAAKSSSKGSTAATSAQPSDANVAEKEKDVSESASTASKTSEVPPVPSIKELTGGSKKYLMPGAVATKLESVLATIQLRVSEANSPDWETEKELVREITEIAKWPTQKVQNAMRKKFRLHVATLGDPEVFTWECLRDMCIFFASKDPEAYEVKE